MRFQSIAVLATFALAAAPLTAQTQDDFKFLGLHAGAPNIDGAYIGPYLGSFDGTPGPTSNGVFANPFDVWCVDYAHHITFGDTYDVWITPMDGSDYSHTRLGSAFAPEYRWTAYFAGLMDWDQVGHTADGARDAKLQDLMWVLMGSTTPTLQSSGQSRSQFLTGFAGTTLGTTLGLNTLAGIHTDWYDYTPSGTYAVYSDWSIITCDPGHNANGAPNAVNSCPYQEFIYMDGSGTPSDITPEPATMTLLATGLIGMAAARKKRRRNAA